MNGDVGAPVTINNVLIRTGDLVVGDSDGVIVIPRDQVSDNVQKVQAGIVTDANRLQHVRAGMGAVDVLEMRDDLKGNVDLVE